MDAIFTEKAQRLAGEIAAEAKSFDNVNGLIKLMLKSAPCHRALQNQPLMGAYRHFKTSHPFRVVTVVKSIRHYGSSRLTNNLLFLAESVLGFLRPCSSVEPNRSSF
jgi:hypothetical protein